MCLHHARPGAGAAEAGLRAARAGVPPGRRGGSPEGENPFPSPHRPRVQISQNSAREMLWPQRLPEAPLALSEAPSLPLHPLSLAFLSSLL